MLYNTFLYNQLWIILLFKRTVKIIKNLYFKIVYIYQQYLYIIYMH